MPLPWGKQQTPVPAAASRTGRGRRRTGHLEGKLAVGFASADNHLYWLMVHPCAARRISCSAALEHSGQRGPGRLNGKFCARPPPIVMSQKVHEDYTVTEILITSEWMYVPLTEVYALAASLRSDNHRLPASTYNAVARSWEGLSSVHK